MKNLKKLRQQAGLTQIQFAHRTGYSRSTIQRYEDGYPMRDETVEAFKKVLRVR